MSPRLPTSPLTPAAPPPPSAARTRPAAAAGAAAAAGGPTAATALALRTLRAPAPAHARAPARARHHRTAVVSWVLELCAELASHPQTPHLALAYYDAVCAVRPGWPADCGGLQLVAAASFLVAAKMMESEVPAVEDLAALTAGACGRDGILAAELLVCETFGFQLYVRVPIDAIPHLCDIAAGVVPAGGMEISVDAGAGAGAEVSRQVSFEDAAADLQAHELLDDDEQDGAAATRAALAAELRAHATAFADVAAHCHALSAQYTPGEVAAACVLLARCAAGPVVRAAPAPDALWMPVCDAAGLRRSAVAGAAALVAHTWEQLLLLRGIAIAVERGDAAARQLVASAADGRHVEADLVAFASEESLPGPLARQLMDAVCECMDGGERVRMLGAAGCAAGAVRFGPRAPALMRAGTDSRNTFVTVRHERVLWLGRGRLEPALAALRNFAALAAAVDATPAKAAVRPLSDTGGNGVTPAGSPATGLKSRLRPRKAIFKDGGNGVSPVAFFEVDEEGEAAAAAAAAAMVEGEEEAAKENSGACAVGRRSSYSSGRVAVRRTGGRRPTTRSASAQASRRAAAPAEADVMSMR